MQIDLNSLNVCTEAKALTDLWATLPREANQICPKKSDFSPVSLRQHLKAVYIFEWQDEDTLLVRIAGTSLRDYLDQEITGKNLFEILPPEFRNAYKDYYTNLRTYSCAGIMKRPLTRIGGGRGRLTSIQLPMLDTQGTSKFIVGAVHLEKQPRQVEHLQNGNIVALNDISTTYIDIGAGIPKSETSP